VSSPLERAKIVAPIRSSLSLAILAVFVLRAVRRRLR